MRKSIIAKPENLKQNVASSKEIAYPDLVKAYFKDISRYPSLTREEEELLGAHILNQDAEADTSAQKLVNCNLRLVVSLAKTYHKQGLDLLDLIQEGNLGLIKAVSMFDYRKGYRLSTYATYWIKNRLSRCCSEKNMKQLDELFMTMCSLDLTVGEEEDTTLSDFIPDDKTPDPANAVEVSFRNTCLREALQGLDPREKAVISLRFGLEDNRPKTLEEVGALLNVSRERVRRIESKVLKKLRMNSQLREYIR